MPVIQYFSGLSYKQLVLLLLSVNNMYGSLNLPLLKMYPLVNFVFPVEVTGRTPSYPVGPNICGVGYMAVSRVSSQ